MKLMVGKGGDHIEISELYCGVALSTNEGEEIGICQRDGIFEISVIKSKSGNPIRIMPAALQQGEAAISGAVGCTADTVRATCRALSASVAPSAGTPSGNTSLDATCPNLYPRCMLTNQYCNGKRGLQCPPR
jgi:hypothetical protein